MSTPTLFVKQMLETKVETIFSEKPTAQIHTGHGSKG